MGIQSTQADRCSRYYLEWRDEIEKVYWSSILTGAFEYIDTMESRIGNGDLKSSTDITRSRLDRSVELHANAFWEDDVESDNTRVNESERLVQFWLNLIYTL